MSLKEYLQDTICHHGPITVARFMHEALLHPQYGYYQTKQPFGREGDFTTAPEISQMFGELIGVYIASIWQQMGQPDDIQIVEMGAGRGTLMHDLLRGTKHIPDFHNSVHISIIDASPSLQALQQQCLQGAHPNICWYNTLSDIPSKPMLFIANELFDALPIHQYEQRKGQWYERMVGVDSQGQLCFMLSKMPNQAIQQEHMTDIDGAVVEMSTASISLMQEIVGRINCDGGMALIIDYGYTQSQYNDTLQAVKQHQYHPVLEDVGHADITAHVDFSALQKASDNPSTVITQGEFLQSLGIKERSEMLKHNASLVQQQDIDSATERLISEDQMGNLFKVMIVS
jgi:NADH dehydrogenase [ubiquinone] 1 alpha subcomplex assembly factor 7